MNLDDQMEIYKKRTDIMPDEDRTSFYGKLFAV